MFEQKYKKETKVHIVCDNIRSAFNVGSIFRTADSTSVAFIHLCGITAQPSNPKVSKTALGALKSVPHKYYANPDDALSFFKQNNIPIYSLELTEKSKHFQDVEYPDELAIILGHEISGVSQPFLDASAAEIYIPMNGIKESLNVANSAAIVLFEILRQKRV